MANTKKRRVKKNRPHQTLKSGGSSGSINWTRILLIVIGVMISLAMILQLVASSF